MSSTRPWNGFLTTSRVLQLLVLLYMLPVIVQFFGGTHHAWKSLADPRGWVFISIFAGMLGSLALLKKNTMLFSILGIVTSVALVLFFLRVANLFTVESLFGVLISVFLIVGLWQHQRAVTKPSVA